MGRAHEKWHICKCLVFHAENLLKVYTQKNSGYTKSRRKIRQQKIPKIDSKFLHIELLSREAWASKDTRFLTLSPDYRFNLDNVCKWYENIRCFPDAMTILHDMTPYFTVAPFLTRGYQVMRSQAILREQTGGILDILLSGKLAEVPSVRLDETFNPVERRNIHISGCCCGRLFKGQRPPCRLHGGL